MKTSKMNDLGITKISDLTALAPELKFGGNHVFYTRVQDGYEGVTQTYNLNFKDSLRNKHLPEYRMVVTSVLRTDADVKSLSKRNVNASERSVHCYGTTFDISYKRFVKVDKNSADARDVDLIAVLAEVLRDLKKNGKCYVKYEVKQACFHITARKRK